MVAYSANRNKKNNYFILKSVSDVSIIKNTKTSRKKIKKKKEVTVIPLDKRWDPVAGAIEEIESSYPYATSQWKLLMAQGGWGCGWEWLLFDVAQEEAKEVVLSSSLGQASKKSAAIKDILSNWQAHYHCCVGGLETEARLTNNLRRKKLIFMEAVWHSKWLVVDTAKEILGQHRRL